MGAGMQLRVPVLPNPPIPLVRVVVPPGAGSAGEALQALLSQSVSSVPVDLG